MPVSPSCDFSLLGDDEAIERIRDAVAARDPFSLIRLGDGEAVVLSYDDDMWLADLAYLHGHWGAEGVTLRSVAEVKAGLEAALTGADIIGVRDDIVGVSAPEDLLDRSGTEVQAFVSAHFHLRPDEVGNLSGIGARRLALLHRTLGRFDWSEDQEFCSAWVHWELLASGALEEILAAIDTVGLVTARPELAEMVGRRFDVRTESVLVPDKHVETPGSGHHVPARFRTIRSELRFDPGTVVLVGAGIPGKVYCQWLKEQGCVALDVGSVFDAWIGKPSRPRVLESRFNVAGGSRVPDHLRLQSAAPTVTRRLVPRWKATGAVD